MLDDRPGERLGYLLGEMLGKRLGESMGEKLDTRLGEIKIIHSQLPSPDEGLVFFKFIGSYRKSAS